MTTEDRLQKLEGQIEGMKTSISTKKLTVVDDQGQERIKLNVPQDGPGLTMSDENEKVRAQMVVSKGKPGLALADDNGKAIWSAP